MTTPDSQSVATALGLPERSVAACLKLLADDCTIPFIARYRKEQTGHLDEVQVSAIRDTWERQLELEKRRATIVQTIADQGNLSPELAQALAQASTLTALEDLYLPYRPKRQTRAQKALERGLEPLAQALWQGQVADPLQAAQAYVQPEAGVPDAASALQGARDILAEQASEQPELRQSLRQLFQRQGQLVAQAARGISDPNSIYRDYFAYQELAAKAPSHRILALLRGADEKILRIGVALAPEAARAAVEAAFRPVLKPARPAARQQIELALADGLDRLLLPALENETLAQLKEKADQEAIAIFAQNLREVLMDSPLGAVPVLALDPGFRTGCKLVVLDAAGNLQFHQAIYPLEPYTKTAEATAVIRNWVQRAGVRAIAIGNGTGGREAQSFCSGLGLKTPEGDALPLVMVNESGASIYSAGEVARAEFPDLDLTVRGAISIGRRLMDPLAELVKLDPKSIGVGQYQHDVDQKALARSLTDTVSSCVNAVGVDLNTASPALLRHVSGVNTKMAQAIVQFRAQQGGFKSRNQLLKVPGIGPKAFEQAAGFLRIRGGEEVLDASAVHPEAYPVVRQMAQDQGVAVAQLIGNPSLLSQLKAVAERYASPQQGVSPLEILEELAKPGRDPRQSFEVFAFDPHIHSLNDLQPGQVLPGVVTNVTAFGAFVDIGVHENGLVHISQLADHYVSNPAQVVKPGQKVRARVLEVDLQRKRIALSLRSEGQ